LKSYDVNAGEDQTNLLSMLKTPVIEYIQDARRIKVQGRSKKFILPLLLTPTAG